MVDFLFVAGEAVVMVIAVLRLRFMVALDVPLCVWVVKLRRRSRHGHALIGSHRSLCSPPPSDENPTVTVPNNSDYKMRPDCDVNRARISASAPKTH